MSDSIPQTIVETIASREAADGKPVSLTTIRAALQPPPMPPALVQEITLALKRLDRQHLIESHLEADQAVGYTLRLEGWLASSRGARVREIVGGMLHLFRTFVEGGKGNYKSYTWDAVRQLGGASEDELFLYTAVCQQAWLTNGRTKPRLDKPGGRLVADFTRPLDFDEIVNLDVAELLARRRREVRERMLAGQVVAEDARNVMQRAYQHLVDDGEWPTTKTFKAELRRVDIKLEEVATANGRLIRGTNATDAGQRTHLTIPALALLDEASEDATLLAKIIRQLGLAYDRDQETDDLPVLEVVRTVGIEDRRTVSRLLRIIAALGSPFVARGAPAYLLETSTLATGDRMLDFIESSDLDDVARILNEQAQQYSARPARVPTMHVPMLDEGDLLNFDADLLGPDPVEAVPRGYRRVPCAVILTALPLEYAAVCALLKDLKEEEHPHGKIYQRGRLERHNRVWDVVVAEIEKGNSTTASEAQRAIDWYEPEVAMFIGVAGGLKDVKLGDVVAATHVFGYESGKEVETKQKPKKGKKSKKPKAVIKTEFLPRPDVGRSSYRMEERAKAESRKPDWRTLSDSAEGAKVHVAPIVAGEKVVATARGAVAEFIRRTYGHAVAIEMEGLGFLHATHSNHIDAIVVRGISDLLAKKSQSDKMGWQQKAAKNAAAFALHMLSRFTPPTLRPAILSGDDDERDRDVASLGRVLKQLPTSVFDRFFDQAAGYVIEDEVFTYWYDLDEEITAGHFYLFDAELAIAVRTLHAGLSKVLSFESYMEQTAGRAWRWRPFERNEEEQWSRDRAEYQEALRDANEAYRRLLDRIKTQYKEIDLLKTSLDAVAQHKVRAAGIRDRTS